MMCRRSEGNAKRETVVLESGRHCNGRIIQEIHEIGVVTKICVEVDRIIQHCIDAVNGSGCGCEQAIDVSPALICPTFESAQIVNTVVSIGGGVSVCAANDFSHRKDYLVTVKIEKFLNCCIAFGYPWTAIQQTCRFQKRRKVDLDDFTS